MAALSAGVGVVAEVRGDQHRRRPAGLAERWLSAVSDVGRKGFGTDPRARAERIGPVATAATVLPAHPVPDEGRFSAIEVGQARLSGDGARVPYRVHQRAVGSKRVFTGVVLMARTGGGWRVTGLAEATGGEKVPSEGGPPVTRAPLAAWLGAAGLSAFLAVGAGLVVSCTERSTRPSARRPSGAARAPRPPGPPPGGASSTGPGNGAVE